VLCFEHGGHVDFEHERRFKRKSRTFSTRVNKPENDDPSIVEPIAIATSAA
jgi:hypothetical protein